MRLHAYAIAQNGTARKRAGGIDRHDPHRAALGAQSTREMIDESALPRPRRARDADQRGPARARKQLLHQAQRLGPAVFDHGGRAGQRPQVAFEDAFG